MPAGRQQCSCTGSYQHHPRPNTTHGCLGYDLKPPRNLGESWSCHVGLERSETAVACVKHLKITTRLPDRVDVWNKKRNFVFWESCGEDWGFTFPGTTLAANSNFDAVNSQRVFPYGLKKHHLLGPTPKVWKSGSSFHVLRMNISKNEPTSATRM